jgi:hypothetical protein
MAAPHTTPPFSIISRASKGNIPPEEAAIVLDSHLAAYAATGSTFWAGFSIGQIFSHNPHLRHISGFATG